MSVINLIKNLFHNLPVFLILICGVVLIATPAKAEERYVRPADVIGDGFKINFKEIQSEKDNSSFRVTFYNTSRNEVLSVNPHKLGFEFVGTPGANGVYYYNSKMSKISNQNFVVLPGKNKSKTIKVEGDFDHRASVIKIHIDGLKKGTLPGASIEMEPLTLSAGDDLEIPNDQLNLIIEKVSNKNGFTVKVKIEFPEYGNDNYLVSFEENKAILTNEGGDKLDLNISTMGKKTIDYDSDMTVTFKTEEELKTAILHLSNALQKIDLSDIAVTPIEVLSEKYAKTLDKNKGSGNATSQVPPAMCPEVVNNGTNGAVEVRVVSDVGCFKLYTSGRELNAESTSNLSFRSDPGIFSTKVYMDNGIMIEKKMLIGDDYDLAYFQIKQKNGKYMLKLSMANSRGKEAPVELTETTFAPDETTCKDKLYLWQQGDPLRNLTVVGITRTHVRYVDCFHPDKVIEIHKNEVSEVVYANGTEDEIASSRIDGKADYDENLIRTREDVYQRHLTKL